MRTPATDAMWAAFRAAHPEAPDACDVVSFGDSPAMADELADLVLWGPKRATAGLLRDFEAEGEPLPAVGGYVLFTRAGGVPAGIWRTTEVRVGPLDSVDEAFAWGKRRPESGPGDRFQARTPGAMRRAWGEGERTRDDWLDNHRRFFARLTERQGWAMTDAEPVVFERFALAWPEP